MSASRRMVSASVASACAKRCVGTVVATSNPARCSVAQFTFDERQMAHLYVATKDHHVKLLRARKEAIKLDLSLAAIGEYDSQIVTNTELRMFLNPRAEEEARV